LEKEERMTQMLNGKQHWNTSTEYIAQSSPHVVKRKSIKLDSYVDPVKRHQLAATLMREQKKEAKRIEEEKLLDNTDKMVFTLGITAKRRQETLNKFVNTGNEEIPVDEEEYDE
jgi:hypothetical protein